MEKEEAKVCPDCHQEKSLDDFPRNRSTGDGRGSYCKPCHNARHRNSIKKLYGGSSRHYHLQKKYGVGAKDVEALIAAQDGLCPICRKRPATQVDHDHKTGQVRGILCLYCNAGMGAFKDDPAIIASAIEYLERQGG